MLKISIVVPVFNTEAYLVECLYSLVNQTYENIEIILIDDGSTDKSGEICDIYAQNDKRIVVKHTCNEGANSARKKGVSMATGDYIMYVDSDDWIDLDVLEKVVDRMGDYFPDIISFGHIKEYPERPDKRPENIMDGFYCINDIEEMQKKIFMCEDYFYIQIISGLIWGKLFKKNIIVENQHAVNNTIRIGEDLAVFDRCYMKSESLMVYNLCAYHYRIRDNSLTKNICSEDYLGCLEFVKCLIDGMNTVDQYKMPQRIISDIFYQIAVCCPKKILTKSETELNLFPEVKRGHKVIIYGKGAFSKGIVEYINETNFVDLVGLTDSSDSHRLFEMGEYDYLIIAITNGRLVKKIKDELIKTGIAESKIVYIKNQDLHIEKLPDEVRAIIKGML